MNAWVNNVDDDRLEAIQTTAEIGNLCSEAKKTSSRVFVHRCAWGGNPATICCSVTVAKVDKIDKRTRIVTFAEPELLGTQPPISPSPGTNFYQSN